MRTSGTTVTGKYNDYTMEVVQQIGSDSFDPGHGVLITKTKNRQLHCGARRCFVWIIDSHPDDIAHVDFVKPDGTPKMATLGDERQLNDASFNAGLDSGSSYECDDTPNRLHFYVLDKNTDAQGILHYKVGVKSLDGAGPADARRGAGLARGATQVARPVVDLHVPAQEHGRRGGDRSGPAPAGRDARSCTSDIYRLSASATGTGWTAQLQQRAGRRRSSARRSGPGLRHQGRRRRRRGSVTLTATSESDPSKTASAVCGLADGDRRRHACRRRCR